MEHLVVDYKLQRDKSLELNFKEDVVAVHITFESDNPWTNLILVYDKDNNLVGQKCAIRQSAEMFFGRNLEESSVNVVPFTNNGPYTIRLIGITNLEVEEDSDISTVVNVYAYKKNLDKYLDELSAWQIESGYISSDWSTWITEVSKNLELVNYDYNSTPINNITANEPDWYSGDTHTHSLMSDGAMHPAENNKAAVELGLDYFMPSEHVVLTTSWVKNDNVLVIPSTEYTTGRGHFNIHFSRKSPYEGGLAKDPYSVEEVLNTLKKLREEGALVQINHPFLKPWELNLEELPLDYIDLIELINDPTYKDNPEGNELTLKAWSILLNWGYDIVAVGGGDAHLAWGDKYEYASKPSRLAEPITWIYADNLSANSLKEGLSNGKVSISRQGRPELLLEDGTSAIGLDLTEETTEELNLTFNLLDATEEGLYHEWVVDGNVVKKSQNNTSQYVVNSNVNWVRVDVRDSNGVIFASVQPLRLNRVEKKAKYWSELLDEKGIEY